MHNAQKMFYSNCLYCHYLTITASYRLSFNETCRNYLKNTRLKYKQEVRKKATSVLYGDSVSGVIQNYLTKRTLEIC